FSGIHLRRRFPLLTHCLFADDTVVFGKATVDEAQDIMGVLSTYGQCTGQEINPEKSSIFFSANTPNSLREDITSELGFASLACHSKYLGVPTDWGRSRKETFSFLIQRMEKQGQAWKGKMLSQAGRETLIKSVIQAIPTYLMSVFFLPLGLSRKMDSLVRNFFWSGDPLKRFIHWSDCETLCLSKKEGGLGFRNFSDFNLALLAKQGWRIMNNPNALWVRLLKSIYFPRRDFFNAKKGARPSWIWASIFKARDTIALGAIKGIGDGCTVDINYDPWIPSLPKFLTPFNGCPSRLVSDWIDPVSLEWKEEEIARYLSPAHIRAILSVPISPQRMKDEWKWSFTKNGVFTVHSAYHAKRNGDSRTTPSGMVNSNEKLWKWLWNLSLPPKIKFFLWRCAKDGLATKVNLFKWKCAPDDLCQVCHQKAENTWHCLFNCHHAREVWSSLMPSFSLPFE
ncbi:Putative ribonuclease H protein At1g65750, partial [Linum perenne]